MTVKYYIFCFILLVIGCASSSLPRYDMSYSDKQKMFDERLTFSQSSSFKISVVRGGNLGFFTSTRRGNKDIYAIDLRTKANFPVLEDPLQGNARISPDGKVIVFQSKSNDPLGDISYADISDLKGTIQLMIQMRSIGPARWIQVQLSFDGRAVYFLTRKLGQTTKYIVRYDFDTEETYEFPSIGCDEIEVIAQDKILCTYQSRLYVWDSKSDARVKVIGDDSFKISQAT